MKRELGPSRREILKLAASGVVSGAMVGVSQAQGAEASNAPADRAEDWMFKLPELPYPADALEPYIDAETMNLHHGKHHAGYTNKLNAAIDGTELVGRTIQEILADLDAIPEHIRTTVRNNGGGYANHSLFWQVMSPDGGGEPSGALADAINSQMGGFDNFKLAFSTLASSVFGSGWAWLEADAGKLRLTSTANQDTPLMGGGTPILGLDVWEHAYYLNYQNRRADYIDAWFHVVNWDRVNELYAAA